MGSNGVLVSGNGCSSDFGVKRKWCGSTDDEVWKNPSNFGKLSSSDFCDNNNQQNMLSFSSPKFGAFSPKENGEFQNFQQINSAYSKNAGYSLCNNGSMNTTSMYFMNGVKGAFTASQWFELEQQALIFKYILANQPIPPNLLIPIRRAFELAGFSGFPAGLFRPNLFGWGPFHLGLASSTDPEVGRCRRTDGKKWRCSRDAVPDQKYCERHINRGRHRSRKPVEGHTGHPISGGTTNKISNSNTSTTNVMNMTSSSSALVVPGGGPANNFATNLSQSRDLQLPPVTSNHLPSSLAHRSMVDKSNITQRMQNTPGLDFLSPRIHEDSRATESTFSITESAAADFPFLTSDATLSTAQGCSYQSYASRTYMQSQHSPHMLMENDPSSILWPKLETRTNTTTKLSISIPPADFMSSTSSPTEERKALSPLRLSREFEADKMHIGSNTVSNEPSPISWETSLGGPLGEVLKTTTSNSSGNQNKSISAINLFSNAAESSPQLASSPTGVLQRTAFSYLSNSSAGSSPRAEHGRAFESGILSGDLIGFTLGSSSSLSRCN